VTGPPAVVLGSSQPDTVVDPGALSRLGVEAVRRRSGGGAVTVAPGAQLWVEAWVPRGDALWDDDIVRAGLWFGELWVRALAAAGVGGLSVHRGRATVTAWSGLVCFAGVGPGEVMAGTTKVVGLSQRRTRAGARLHTMAALRWAPGDVLRLLEMSELERSAGQADLAASAVGLDQLAGDDRPVDVETVWAALVAGLPQPE
jgi:lipoate-protein ligase A